MKKLPYFKCYFCHRISSCAIKALDKGIVLCKYGTLLSIWQWIVRGVALLIPTLVVVGLIKFYILPHWLKILISVLGGVIVILLGVILVLFLNQVHCQFKASGGVYFWWNEKKTSDDEDTQNYN